MGPGGRSRHDAVSIEAFSQTLYAPLGGNPKVVLLGLANHARPDGSGAYPCMNTLAVYAGLNGEHARRSAQRIVRKLEADGWIERDGIGSKGQHSWRLCFENWPRIGDMQATLNGDGSPTTPPVHEPRGGAVHQPPEPSLETVHAGKQERARVNGNGRPDPETIPDDFPAELRPHARAVLPILRTVAEQHNAKAVPAGALARVIMGRPRKPLVKAAHDFAAWATTSRKLRDVTAAYRNWLDRESDLAGPEQLPGTAPARPNGHGPPGRPPSEREERRAERDRVTLARVAAMQGAAPGT